MKSFAGLLGETVAVGQASVRGRVCKEQPQGAANLFEGTITSNLPVELEDVYLVYGGEARGGQPPGPRRQAHAWNAGEDRFLPAEPATRRLGRAPAAPTPATISITRRRPHRPRM